MAYTAWSVVYGEQPTAAKWNQLGQNDAGFRDGTNILDDAIVDRLIDYASLKTFIPDYANQEATNRWASVTSFTITARGFIYFMLYFYKAAATASASVTINGKKVSESTIEQAASNGARPGVISGVLPVQVGDVISYTVDNTVNQKALYLIPGRWV